jgi:hypothetical protein
MSGQIFISYRREESRWSARSLRDRLCRDFDPKQIFIDIDAIALGEDFVEAIETTVAKCDVLIAVIGNNWLTTKDDYGNRRLDNSQDFVRMEIGAALKRKIRVIPVLVDGASMPRPTELPEDLRSLVRRNALSITDTSFDGDCQRLAAAIRLVFEKAAAEQRQREEKAREGVIFEGLKSSQKPEAALPAAAQPTAPPLRPLEIPKITPDFMVGCWQVGRQSRLDFFDDGRFSGLAAESPGSLPMNMPVSGRWKLISLDDNKFRLIWEFADGRQWQRDFIILDRNRIHNIEENYVADRVTR